MDIEYDIEEIVKQMTEASKKFYQDKSCERNIQKCIQHRDFLQGLMDKVQHTPDRSKRALEVMGILNDAIVYFSKQITRLARNH